MNILDPVKNLAVCTANAGYDNAAVSVVLSSGHGASGLDFAWKAIIL